MKDINNEPLSEEEQKRFDKLLADSHDDLKNAIKLAVKEGVQTLKDTINEKFTFHMGAQEVKLHIRELEVLKKDDEIISFKIQAKGEFKQVLKLAKALNINISAYKKSFKIELRARKELLDATKDYLLLSPTIEELMGIVDGQFKRPVFLNMYLYHVDRIYQ